MELSYYILGITSFTMPSRATNLIEIDSDVRLTRYRLQRLKE